MWENYSSDYSLFKVKQEVSRFSPMPNAKGNLSCTIEEMYRVTHHVGPNPNLLLTPKQRLDISTCASYYNGTLVLMSTDDLDQHYVSHWPIQTSFEVYPASSRSLGGAGSTSNLEPCLTGQQSRTQLLYNSKVGPNKSTLHFIGI